MYNSKQKIPSTHENFPFRSQNVAENKLIYTSMQGKQESTPQFDYKVSMTFDGASMTLRCQSDVKSTSLLRFQTCTHSRHNHEVSVY